MSVAGHLEGEGQQDDADEPSGCPPGRPVWTDRDDVSGRLNGAPPDRPVPRQRDRALSQLALAAVLVVIVGASLGLDAAMAVAFSLAVMEAARSL